MPGRKKILTPEQEQQLIGLYQGGSKYSEIKTAMGILSAGLIASVLKRYNVPLRNPNMKRPRKSKTSTSPQPIQAGVTALYAIGGINLYLTTHNCTLAGLEAFGDTIKLVVEAPHGQQGL